MSAPTLDHASRLRQRVVDLGYTLIMLVGLLAAAFGAAADSHGPLTIGAVLVSGGWVASVMCADIHSHPRT